ncbi:MAG TPA: response regulator transcription factor [Candidatus Scatovivens faecipullorum]|nr:response regulator transcription factor [Candidatus Scatovivens faecipullorum]
MKRILVVEDEKDIQNIIKAFLENAEYKVETADDGLDAINLIQKNNYDLILLDIMLPKIDGFTVCEMIRKNSNIPIIILTALTDEESQLKGFDKLADDYITKPFSMPVLLKHIEAIFRRTNNSNENTSILKYKNITLNTENYEVYVDNQKVTLTFREYEILKLFLENQGKVFTRDNILNSIWNYDYFGDDKIVNTHIKNIRKKLGYEYIETVRGVGYKIDKEDKK